MVSIGSTELARTFRYIGDAFHELAEAADREAGIPDLLTPKEVAAVLKVNVQTVYRQIKAGKLEAIRVGDTYRVRSESLGEISE